MQDLSRFQHPRFARAYDRMSRRAEPVTGELRTRLLDGLSGRVLEVGAEQRAQLPPLPAGRARGRRGRARRRAPRRRRAGRGHRPPCRYASCPATPGRCRPG
ncbi:hypothetical protein ACFSTC_14240 [Nonomuraea ferruginea]